jgi:hypothetical protein
MKNKNLPIIIGVALPLVFIVVISIIIFTPTLFVKPGFNFLYTTMDNYYGYNQGYKNTYKVVNNHIELEPIPLIEEYNKNIPYKAEAPTIYLYDVTNNSSHEISLEEAKKFFLDPGPSSPDGYSIKYQYGHDGIFELFGSNNNRNGYFIAKDSGAKKLEGLKSDRYWGSEDLKFIGWIK